jgi:hypothetical protein
MAQSKGKGKKGTELADRAASTTTPGGQNPPPPFFQNRAQLVSIGIAVISLIASAAFFFGALHMKTDLGERIAKVETKLDVFESAVRKQLIAKAQELLSTDNVQVALVNQRSDTIFPISEKLPPVPVPRAKDKKEWFATYEIEGIKKKSLILRLAIAEVVGGKVTRKFYEQRAEILIPPVEEKRVFYDFKLFQGEKEIVSIPPVRLEIVVVEQVSAETLVVAISLGLTPEAKRA